jgi:hypothetical protein
MANTVLSLFEGLDKQQAQKLQALAVPVLGEVRKCLLSGERALVIDLEKLPQQKEAEKPCKAGEPASKPKKE